ncbi:obscurin-like protein 1 isoform X4 [Osmerus mordax]|uniref:obscurin-like protein 1 isoform X4 n=1 Tax=Osmerus mordax TaxID=8014 RepID=UPI00350EA2E7
MDVFGGAPRFLAYPRPVMVQSSTDAMLKCQIGGDPRPAVVWERNNEKIDPEGRYRVFEDGNVYNLIISAVTVEDSGQYICKAKNSIGETYAAATLKVEGEAQEMELREENKPRFLIKPLSTRVGRGEDAVFSCKLWGNPRPEVVWEKDGRKLNEIFESTHFSVGYQDGGWFQLKIFKTRAPDGGVYTCKARNEYGEGLAGAVLLVDAGPSHEEEGNRNGYTNGHWKAHQAKQRSGRQVATRLREDTVTTAAKVKMFAVTEGKHAKFRCFVTGKPKPEIIWRKDGRLILSGRRYLLYEDREGYFTLKVLYCKQKDNGVYVCAASNTAGKTLSAVHLSVKEPPVRFKQPLIDLEVWERDLAVLECEVPEDSVPITWYLEDRRLQPGAKYGMEEWGTKRRLTIRDIGVDDDGIYLCEMPDGGRSIAEVAVKGTIMRKLPRKVDVLEGENAAFCVEVEEEEMDIHWYKEGTELRETHQTILKSFGRTHILVFVNTTPQDSGLVTFFVGRSKTSSQLRVKAARHCPPSCPVGVQMNTERANAALLSWVPAQDSKKNPPSGYVLERQEVGTGSQEWLQCLTTDSATSVEILGDSVPCEADYRFRICGVNKYGRSPNVEFPRTVHLVPVARIQAPLQDALVPEGQDACFSIELSASVIGTWFLNGTQVQEDERFSTRRSRTHQSLRIRVVRDTENGAEITFIAYGIRDSAALYIQAPLVKFTPLSEMDRNKFVEVGNPIVLYCELSDPAVPVHWYKNGVELHTEEGLHIQSEGTMRRIVIQSAEFSHSGVYCCDAIDDVIRFNVEVEAPPVRFSAAPEAERTKSIPAGGPLVLQCELSDPTAQVHWYKDGTKLLPQSGIDLRSDGLTRTLVVQSAELFHAGSYSCKTKGDAIQFNVDVKAPPAPPVRITTPCEAERNQTIEAGSPIVLRCEISDPHAQVAWYREGLELHEQPGQDIRSEGAIRTLVVHLAMMSHAGVYICKTTDDTMHFHVDVKAPPLKFTAMSEADKEKSVQAGSHLCLQCELSDPTAEVSWFKDGAPLLLQSVVDILSDGTIRTLSIHSAELSHSGMYRCETLDDAIQFTVGVKAPPVRFSAAPEPERTKSVPAGGPLVLQCELSDPTAQVHWYKDGTKLLPQRGVDLRSDGLTRTLVVQSAEISHSGIYECLTADDTVTFKVDIKGPFPQILPEPSVETYRSTGVDSSIVLQSSPVRFSALPEIARNKFVEAGCPIILQCEVSDPAEQVCWQKDGVELLPERELEIQSEGPLRAVRIESAEFRHAGLYCCEAVDDRIEFKVDVAAPPVTFVDLPDEDLFKSVVEQDRLTLSCEVSKVDAIVQWYKDGVEMQPGDDVAVEADGARRSLILKCAQLADTGTYTCRVGDTALMFKVNIREPPVMIVHPKEDVHLDRHVPEEIILSCELSRPNGVVNWFKDGQKLQESENIKLKVEGPYRRLKILCSGVEDSGEYVCDTADDSIFFHLSLTEPPVRIVSPSQSQMELCQQASERMVLSCEISRPNAVVRWYRDGLEVEENNNLILEVDGVYRRLIIPETTVKDSAEYVCDTADDSVTFFVNIAEPPVRFVRPRKMASGVEKCFGESLVLDCEVSRPNAEVSWKKNGEEMEESSNLTIVEDGIIRQLTIHSLTLEDAGQYVCDAKDDVMDFQVKIKEPPVSIIGNSGHPEKHILVAGDDLILECEVSRPNATVQWLWNGKLLSYDSRTNIDSHETTRKLVLSRLQPSDSGEYTCDAGEDKMRTLLEVQEPPVKFMNKQAMMLSAYENESVTLCAMVNRDKANVRWLKDGRLLNEDNIHISNEGHTHTLIINPLKLSDSGEYICDVTTDEMYFTVQVKEMKMTFTKPLENISSLKDSSLTLRCEVNKPKGDVQWLKNSQDITPNRRHTIRAQGRERSFTIHKLTAEDAGEYSCESTDDRTVATVTVEIPRIVEFIAELHNITVQEGEDATFKCVVSPEDTELVWRLDGKLLTPSERFVVSSNGLCHMLCIHTCRVSDSSTVTASAEGLLSDANLRVQEEQTLFTKNMAPVVAEEFSEATLEVEVSLGSGEVQWMRQGVVIHPGPKFTLKQKGRKRSLTIHRLALSDRGTYSCETLHDRTQALLSVEPRKISIRKGLTDIQTTERETASFEVELSHTSVVGTWHRNGVQLKPNNHWRMSAKGHVHSLTISNLSLDDTGSFMFCVENLKTSSRLVVKEPPVTILKTLEDIRRPEGAVVSIECELSRHNVEVKWMKNGSEMNSCQDYRIYGMGRKRFLQILKSTVEDSGVYVCDSGEASTSCTVEIYERELQVLQGLEDLEMQEDQNAVFVCEISLEDVPGEWFKDGEKITPTSTIKIRQEGTKHFLLMCNVRGEDSGEIKFVAKHIESIAYLEVEELPVSIVNALQDRTALEKQRVVLDCTVSNPRCSIRWYKGRNVILPSERFEICSEGCCRKLVIQQVALEDEGTYSVQVGDYTCSARLTVEAQSLLMVKELEDTQVVAPEEACFECEVSMPVLKAPLWTLKGEALQQGPRVRLERMGTVHRLTLCQTSVEMSGLVEFTSGKEKSKAQLHVTSDP